MKLTQEQEQAIANTDRDMTIIAAAGAGKTFVLTEMVARLVQELEVPLEEIVLVTFTEKAAGELKDRLARRLKKPRSHFDDCPIGTIHSFAASRLRKQAHCLPKNFVIWEENRAALERSRIVHQEIKALLSQADAELAALVDEYGWRSLTSLMTSLLGMRWKMRAVEEEGSYDQPHWPTCRDLYRHIHHVYTEHKRSHGALDFEDLEEESLRLMEDSKSAPHAYRYIIVDEYQDISPPQYKLIQGLHRPGVNRLVIVGDPFQSIYRFRGADVSLFYKTRDRLAALGASEVSLTTNFRTATSLIDSLNVIFQAILGADYQSMRGEKDETVSPPFQVLDLPMTKTLTERRGAEAEAVAAHLAAMIEEGRRPGEMALLFRSRSAMAAYEEALAARGIAFQSQKGKFLLEQQEIIDQINVFRALCQPQDELALVGVARSPLGGVTDETLWSFAGRSLRDCLKTVPSSLPEQQKSQWHEFAQWCLALEQEASYLLASEVADRIFQRARRRGYYAEGQARANLMQWISFLQWMEEVDPFELKDLLEVIEGYRQDGARILERTPPDDQKDCVQLMTVHAAKGLEFPIVVVADLTAAIPSPREPILIEAESGIGMRRLDPEAVGLRDQMIDTEAYLKVKKHIREQEIAESRRLLYVACTRAQECLILPLDRARKERQPTWNQWLCDQFCAIKL